MNLTYYEDPLPFEKIGDLMMMQDKPMRASDWYRKALARREENASANAKLGNALVLGQQFAQAIAPLNRALEIDGQKGVLDNSRRSTVYYYLALSHANLKAWAAAETALDAALSLNPDFAAARKLRQQIRAVRGG